MTRFYQLCAVAIIALVPAITFAGSSASSDPILPATQVVTFANQVQADLARKGASVAIVSRMGRSSSQMPDGVRYTHIGLWVYSKITLTDGSTGQGYRVYNLYQQNGNRTRSDLVQDSPTAFFAGAQQLDAGIIIPDPKLQRKLRATLRSPTYAALHNPRYSVLANPSTSQYQNCTEHTLDVLIASIYGTSDIGQIKANIAAYFDPQIIQIGGAKRALAAIASPALNTDDHGPVIGTATFGSISRFLHKYELAQNIYRITPAGIFGF
jgi:hypothetical protein